MNKIRKLGEHPGKGRIPGIRPISIKETRNKERMERIMSDTASFISEKLQKVEGVYSASTDLFGILGALSKTFQQTAQSFIDRANSTEQESEKIEILHRCIVTLLAALEQTDQAARMSTLRYQHEAALLNSMAAELSVPEEEEAGEEVVDESMEDEEEVVATEETTEDATE